MGKAWLRVCIKGVESPAAFFGFALMLMSGDFLEKRMLASMYKRRSCPLLSMCVLLLMSAGLLDEGILASSMHEGHGCSPRYGFRAIAVDR